MLEGEGGEGWPFSGQPISWNWVTVDDVARVQMGTGNRPITVMCKLVNNPTFKVHCKRAKTIHTKLFIHNLYPCAVAAQMTGIAYLILCTQLIHTNTSLTIEELCCPTNFNAITISMNVASLSYSDGVGRTGAFTACMLN